MLSLANLTPVDTLLLSLHIETLQELSSVSSTSSFPPIAKPLLIHGTINNCPLRILIDTGSDVDLISKRTVKRLNLPTSTCSNQSPFTLERANGQTIGYITHFAQLPLKLPG